MPNINATIKRFRVELAAREEAATGAIIRAYTRASEAIASELAALSVRVAMAQEAGQYSPSWAYQEGRLQSLMQQVQSEIAGFVGVTRTQLTGLAVDYVGQAQEHTRTLIEQTLGRSPAGTLPSFTRLPRGAVENIVGALSDGSPVDKLLQAMPGETAQAVKDKLTTNLAMGKGMEETAREIKPDVGGNLVRALSITRTESLRAYRSSALATYEANSDVVRGWIWSAQMSSRTCAMCIAMSGTKHPISEPFGSHVMCRCVPIPLTATWAEMGFPDVPDTAPTVQDGAEWFAAQDAETQKAILGPGKLALYQDGQMSLADVVGFREDADWGPVRFERSLADVTAEAAEHSPAAPHQTPADMKIFGGA